MPVSDPDVSRPRLIRDATFLAADRALKTEFVLQYMSEPQLRATPPLRQHRGTFRFIVHRSSIFKRYDVIHLGRRL